MLPFIAANGKQWVSGLLDCRTKEAFISEIWTPDCKQEKDVRALVALTAAWVCLIPEARVEL